MKQQQMETQSLFKMCPVITPAFISALLTIKWAVQQRPKSTSKFYVSSFFSSIHKKDNKKKADYNFQKGGFVLELHTDVKGFRIQALERI